MRPKKRPKKKLTDSEFTATERQALRLALDLAITSERALIYSLMTGPSYGQAEPAKVVALHACERNILQFIELKSKLLEKGVKA